MGTWKDSFAGVRTVPSALIGTSKFPYCSGTHTLSVTLDGSTAFTTNNRYNGGSDCVGFIERLTFGSTCGTASGLYRNDGANFDGAISWTRSNALQLTRTTLTTASASAQPLGGLFSHLATTEAGSNVASVALAGGTTPASNPSQIVFAAPTVTGAPRPGGRIKLSTRYAVNGQEMVNDRNKVITFGMSCYMVALEGDYGSGPSSCASTRISGVTYSGTVTNPNGLTGTFCSSFIANVRLQGTGQLSTGEYINYNPTTRTMKTVPEVTGSDNTPVVAGQTVARDLAIIPGRGVLVDVDGVGTGLLANDRGGHILGYRLDLFNGAGKAACADYANPVGIAACQPAQGNTCPERTFQ